MQNDGTGTKPYTLYKTLDPSLKVGDFVIVPTDSRHKMTVARVEAVDADVDFESPTEVKWIVARINKEENDNILAEEKKWIETLKQSEKRRKREEIKKNMLAMYEDDGIDKLAIAHMQGASDPVKIEG